MRNKSIVVTVLSVVAAIIFLSGCATIPKPTKENFIQPVVTLSHIEVEHYWGWWYYDVKVKPTKGNAGKYGAPLDLSFILEIENKNPYPVMMDSLKFTVAFEEFDLNTVSSTETMWIPPGKTNQIRVHAMFDGRQSLLSLLVTGGFKLKEKGLSVWEQLEKWWVGVPEFSFPVHVKEGAAVFSADGMTNVVSFNSTFP